MSGRKHGIGLVFGTGSGRALRKLRDLISGQFDAGSHHYEVCSFVLNYRLLVESDFLAVVVCKRVEARLTYQHGSLAFQPETHERRLGFFRARP